MNIPELLTYGFIQRAILTGVMIGILCSLLGLFLILRRMSLIGDGLAHVTFGATAITASLRLYSAYSLLATIPIMLASSLLILKLTDKTRLSGDVAIGIISSAGIAIGIIVTSNGGGYNTDIFGYLFGNILAISREEVLIAFLLFVFVSLMICFFYNDLFYISFNEELAKISGIRTRLINSMLALLTALSVLLAMKLVGIMLISSLLILPAASALQVARSFRTCLILSATQGSLSVILGIYVALCVNLPASATIVLINLLIFLAATSVKRLFSKEKRAITAGSKAAV